MVPPDMITPMTRLDSSFDRVREWVVTGVPLTMPTWPLMEAVMNPQSFQVDLVRLLVDDYGADVNKQDKDGKTALWYAVGLSKPSEHETPADLIAVVQMLIDHGANWDLKTKKGHTALKLANHLKNQKIIQLFRTPEYVPNGWWCTLM